MIRTTHKPTTSRKARQLKARQRTRTNLYQFIQINQYNTNITKKAAHLLQNERHMTFYGTPMPVRIAMLDEEFVINNIISIKNSLALVNSHM